MEWMGLQAMERRWMVRNDGVWQRCAPGTRYKERYTHPVECTTEKGDDTRGVDQDSDRPHKDHLPPTTTSSTLPRADETVRLATVDCKDCKIRL